MFWNFRVLGDFGFWEHGGGDIEAAIGNFSVADGKLGP